MRNCLIGLTPFVFLETVCHSSAVIFTLIIIIFIIVFAVAAIKIITIIIVIIVRAQILVTEQKRVP